MRAGLRLGLAILAAGLALGQAPAHAQSDSAATSNTPQPETIGPRELQNFSLPGTVTRPAEQPAAPPSTSAPAPRPVRTAPAPPAESGPVRSAQTRPRSPSPSAAWIGCSGRAAARPARGILDASVALPPATSAPELPQPAIRPGRRESPHRRPRTGAPPMFVWLMLAAVLGGGAALLLWRRRSRAAFADGSQFEYFSAPEPEPALPPPPQPSHVPVDGFPRLPFPC